MKLTDYFNKDASTDWFSKPYRELSVHESLSNKNFKIIDRETLLRDSSHVEIPVSLEQLSWNSKIPRPKEDKINTYIAKELCDLKEDKFNSQILSDIISSWMRDKLTGTKYLVSLNPEHYLVASSDTVAFEDVFTVSLAWSIDSWIGVFDEAGTLSFIFDTEFWVTIMSCDPSILTKEIQDFSTYYNDEFKEIFIRDNHLLSHADPERVQEYFERIYTNPL